MIFATPGGAGPAGAAWPLPLAAAVSWTIGAYAGFYWSDPDV